MTEETQTHDFKRIADCSSTPQRKDRWREQAVADPNPSDIIDCIAPASFTHPPACYGLSDPVLAEGWNGGVGASTPSNHGPAKTPATSTPNPGSKRDVAV